MYVVVSWRRSNAAEYHCNVDLSSVELLLPSTEGAGIGIWYGCQALMGCDGLPAASSFYWRA